MVSDAIITRISATYLLERQVTNGTRKIVKEGKFQVIFISPEALHSLERRNVLASLQKFKTSLKKISLQIAMFHHTLVGNDLSTPGLKR